MIFIGNHQSRNVVKSAEFCAKLWGLMGGLMVVIGPSVLLWGVLGANSALAPTISGAVIAGLGLICFGVMAYYLCLALKTDDTEYKDRNKQNKQGGNKVHPRQRGRGHGKSHPPADSNHPAGSHHHHHKKSHHSHAHAGNMA